MDVAAGDPVAGGGRINPGLASAPETQVEARDEARLVTRAFGRLPARWPRFCGSWRWRVA
jgi:hypothetical protein